MVVITVAQVTLQRNVQHTIKRVIHVTKRGILSHIAGPDKEARAKENEGLTQPNPDNPGMTSMKLLQIVTKVMTPTGSNLNRTLCKCCLVEVSVLTLNQTYSLMKLMVKEFNVCLLT